MRHLPQFDKMKVFLTSMFICFVLADRTPQIVLITEDQVKNIGSTVELSCSVLHLQPDNTVVWKKEGLGLPITSDTQPLIRDSRYSLRYDSASTTYTLQIKDVQDTDAGLYKCQIWMSPNNYVSKEVRLLVYSAPVIFDNSSSTLVVSEKTSVKLECYASGLPKPQISWKRENNALLPTGGSIYRGSVLKINSVRKEDRGTYYCAADNKVGSKVRKSVAVEVEFPPIVHAVKKEVLQAPHYDAELHCRIEAFPSPVIVWSKDGIQLSNNQHYKIYQGKAFGEFTESILRVFSVEPRQYGTYVCKAVNKLGDGETHIDLWEADSAVCPPACGSGHYSAGSIVKPTSVVLVPILTYGLALLRDFLISTIKLLECA